MVLVFITLPWIFAAAPFNVKTGAAAYPLQATPQPLETRTPLPTLVISGNAAGSGSYVLVGLMLVCVMGLLLAVGVGAAILLVRLRNHIG